MNLITAAMYAPLVTVRESDPNLLHAATLETIAAGWGDGDDPHFVSACGIASTKLLGVQGEPVLWPVRVATLPSGTRRCRECHRATGRMRPRSTIKVAAS